jgi:predicted O-methyltransferase YrrM
MNDYAHHIPELEAIVRNSGESLEGNCVYQNGTLVPLPFLETKRQNLFLAAQGKRRICEIGFNAGHSALLFLLAAERESTFVFFDLGEHAYTRPCAEYVERIGMSLKCADITWVYGDSRTTMPRWIQTNPHSLEAFDVVHVDGGHSAECATSDLAFAYLLAKPQGLIIVDDIQSADIRAAINTWTSQGILAVDTSFQATYTYPHVVLRKLI